MMFLEFVYVVEVNLMLVFVGVFCMYLNLSVGGVVMVLVYGFGLGGVGSLGDLVRKVKWVNVKGEVIVSIDIEL